jgi:hypothetical protein
MTEDDPEDASDPDDEPLGDLVREIREKRATHGADDASDPDAESDDSGAADAFESVEVPELDEEAVWAAFDGDEAAPEARAGVGIGGDPEATPEDDEAVVPKRTFCQRCPHFTDPPNTACSHEGTTIVEVVDADHLRVRNCPIVAEERDVASFE